jgi:hypothetical protein
MMTRSNVSQTFSRIIAEEKRSGHEYFSAEKFLDPASSRLTGLRLSNLSPRAMMTRSNISQTLSRIIAEEKRFGHEYFSAEKFLDPASSRSTGLRPSNLSPRAMMTRSNVSQTFSRIIAEEKRFELLKGFHPCWFSKPVPSTTQPLLLCVPEYPSSFLIF